MKKFWNAVRNLFADKTRGVMGKSAEDYADMVLADLVGGYDPRAESGVRFRSEDEDVFFGMSAEDYYNTFILYERNERYNKK